MKAIYLKDNQIRLTEQRIPQIKDNEVLIRVAQAGICSTDLEIVKGYIPNFDGILGHEFVGTVEQIGRNVNAAWQGKRATSTINIGCNSCAECAGSGFTHCPDRTVVGIINRDGAFAEFIVVPESNLVSIPNNVSDKLAVFTEPLAAALKIREQLVVPPTEEIGVIGPGRLGMLIGWALSLSGNQVTMLGRRPESLELARRWGLGAEITEQIPDNRFGFVVDSTGNEAGLGHALRITRPKGTIVLKSTYAGPANVDLTKLVVAELNVVGSRCGPFEPAIRLLQTQQALKLLDLIDEEFNLDQGLEAFQVAEQSGIRKVLLNMPS